MNVIIKLSETIKINRKKSNKLKGVLNNV